MVLSRLYPIKFTRVLARWLVIDNTEFGDSFLLRSDTSERLPYEKALPAFAHHIISVYELCDPVAQPNAQLFVFSLRRADARDSGYDFCVVSKRELPNTEDKCCGHGLGDLFTRHFSHCLAGLYKSDCDAL